MRRRVTVRGAARRIAVAITEMNQAQRKIAVLGASPDRYLPGGAKAPDTYAEFLFRTSGPLLREPAADRRRRGELVR